jgi:hypothetical protein
VDDIKEVRSILAAIKRDQEKHNLVRSRTRPHVFVVCHVIACAWLTPWRPSVCLSVCVCVGLYPSVCMGLCPLSLSLCHAVCHCDRLS